MPEHGCAVPPGTFVGQLDLTTGALTGNLTLPPAKQSISILGIPLATATFALSSNGPVQGTVNLAAGTVSMTASFTFNITSVSATILPRLNLVGNNCHGSQPITQTLSGPFSLTRSQHLLVDLHIPKFAGLWAAHPDPEPDRPGLGQHLHGVLAPAAELIRRRITMRLS